MAEWLRRLTRNQIPSGSIGSNPINCGNLTIVHINILIYFFCQTIWVCKQRWFSGRMLACHAGGPGSIPGRCKFFTIFLLQTRRWVLKWYIQVIFYPPFPFLWGIIQVRGCLTCTENRWLTCVMFPHQCHLPGRMCNYCPAQKQDQLIGCSCLGIHNNLCLNSYSPHIHF